MDDLSRWTEAVCAELGLDPGDIDREVVLDLARDVAHGVLRPAAPLTTYVLGLAVGRQAAPSDAVTRVTELARRWEGGS